MPDLRLRTHLHKIHQTIYEGTIKAFGFGAPLRAAKVKYHERQFTRSFKGSVWVL